MSDIDIALVDSLKALDPEPPIKEADMGRASAPERGSNAGHRQALARIYRLEGS